MNSDTKAKLFYRSLWESTSSSRFKLSLERVSSACDALEKQRSPITIAAVGHHCESAHGGPKIQSIRNSKNSLALYIRLRAAEQLGTKSRLLTDNGRPAIESASLNAYVTTLEIQLEEANAELRRVREGVRQLKPLDPQGIGNLLDGGDALSIGESAVSERERQDLKGFLDPAKLSSCGISEVDGELEFASGLVLLQRDGLAFLKRSAGDS